MQLWTWQGRDFSLFEGRVDWSRSEYVQTEDGIPGAYAKLARRLRTDQLIWCYTVPDAYILLPGDTKVGWELDVPDSNILGFIDDIVWNRILGIQCQLPEPTRLKWKNVISDN